MRTIKVKSLFTKGEFIKVELLSSKRDGKERKIIINSDSVVNLGTKVKRYLNLNVSENYKFEMGLPSRAKGGIWTVQK
jgi:hypothetical protein